MGNRDMPAKPVINAEGFPSHGSVIDKNSCTGLTKLEYAAIHIMAVNQSIPGKRNSPKAASFDAVEKANALFDELEKQEK